MGFLRYLVFLSLTVFISSLSYTLIEASSKAQNAGLEEASDLADKGKVDKSPSAKKKKKKIEKRKAKKKDKQSVKKKQKRNNKKRSTKKAASDNDSDF